MIKNHGKTILSKQSIHFLTCCRVNGLLQYYYKIIGGTIWLHRKVAPMACPDRRKSHMKLTFLGTSHGVPAADRYCQSILAQTENGGYIIDAGAPVFDCLLRQNVDINKIRAVFITHMHGDHVDCLFELIGIACWYYTDMRFDVFLPEQKGIDAVTAFLEATLGDPALFPNDRVRLRLMKEGEVYQDGEMKVTAFPTGHLRAQGRPAYGYLLESGGKRVYISGDLNGETIDYPAFLEEEPVDSFVVECAHFPAERLAERLLSCKAEKVLPVHVWPLDKYDILKQAESTLPFPMAYPADGDSYVI